MVGFDYICGFSAKVPEDVAASAGGDRQGRHPQRIIPVSSRQYSICEAVPRRAHIAGSQTFVSLNSRLESNKEEQEEYSILNGSNHPCDFPAPVNALTGTSSHPGTRVAVDFSSSYLLPSSLESSGTTIYEP